MSMRENILAAVLAIADPIANATAYRSREAALARMEGAAILIRPEEETVVTLGYGASQRDLVVLAEVIARGQIPDKVADPIVQAFHAALMVDPTLGGLVARTIEESTKWNFEIADQNAVAIEIRYRVRYLTPVNSLASTI